MKLTPLDIHHKEFRRSIRGYNEEDVDVFLDQVAEEFERLFKESTELKERVESMNDKVTQYEGVEQTLQKALFTGQQAADQVKENAQKESELIVGDAEKKAQDIIKDVQKEKAIVVAELKRLREAEERFRTDFKDILNTFLVEADEVKVTELPREAEEAIAVAPEPQEKVEEASTEEPVAAPEAVPGPEIVQESNEPAALDVDAISEGDSQAPIVPTDIEPPVVGEMQPDLAAPVEPQAETDVPVEPKPMVGESELHDPSSPIGSPTSADVAGNFFSAPEPKEEPADKVSEVSEPAIPEPTKTDYFTESPQAPDIGAGDSFVEEKVQGVEDEVEVSTDTQPTSEFKITLGAPVHETSADSPDSEPSGSGIPTDVLAELNNQEVPEFDPAAKKESDSNSTGDDDVVSSFFDDDLGGDD